MESPGLGVENLFEITYKKKNQQSLRGPELSGPHKYDSGGGPGILSSGCLRQTPFRNFKIAHESAPSKEM